MKLYVRISTKREGFILIKNCKPLIGHTVRSVRVPHQRAYVHTYTHTALEALVAKKPARIGR